MHMKSWYGNLSERDDFQYICVDRRIILKCVLEGTMGGGGATVWLRMDTISML